VVLSTIVTGETVVAAYTVFIAAFAAAASLLAFSTAKRAAASAACFSTNAAATLAASPFAFAGTMSYFVSTVFAFETITFPFQSTVSVIVDVVVT